MTEEATEKKYISRKFIAWLIASIFTGAAIVYAFAKKDNSLAQALIPWWGGITMIYIGGNVAQKFATPKIAEEPEENA